ncbi:MAG: cobalamin biosynthesis protein CobW [Rhizobiaceae bacterium]|jgi:cobalamin biosynthesis protein CobW|nr:cobalamin biosynthesis protein CobW [Rhizobiaceae bacterium]
MNLAKIPATVITGFLGSGKTTLIRSMLENANGKRLALIINEFGDLGVDGGILKGCGIDACREEDVIELNNGCICCTVADDFLPAMEKLINRPDAPDHIIIETSGLALPQPLVAAFNWPDVKARVTVDGVVTVVDAAAVSEGRFADDHTAVDAQRAADASLDHDNPIEELFEDQLTAADLIILAKADLLDATAMAQVKADVAARMSRKVSMVESANASVPNAVLLGLDAATEDQIHLRRSHHEMEHEGADHDHDHDEFESFIAETGAISDVKRFEERMKAVIAKHDILRFKGFADVPGKPMRLVVQAVGTRIVSYFDRPWAAGESRASRFVVIGEHHDMDEPAIRADILAAAA